MKEHRICKRAHFYQKYWSDLGLCLALILHLCKYLVTCKDEETLDPKSKLPKCLIIAMKQRKMEWKGFKEYL